MNRAKKIAFKVLQNVFAHLPRSGPRRILLDVKNTVTATYLEDFRRLLADDNRVKFSMVLATDLKPEDRRQCRSRVQCPEVGTRTAQIIPWDLMVVADHPRHTIADPRRFPVLRISHGIGGKMVDGHDYFYGPRLYAPDGSLRYTRIFEASRQRYAQFVIGHPLLENAVRLVGDLRIDQLRAASSATTSTPGGRPKIVIASSWSRQNLLEKHGQTILAQARPLLQHYEVIIRPHPHFFKTDAAPVWNELFAEMTKAGLTLSRPHEELSDVLATAAAVVCDDLSSVALYALVLSRPLILCPSGSSQVAPESFLGRLGKIVPTLNAVDNLGSWIGRVMHLPLTPQFIALAEEINSRPGQAAFLMQKEAYDLLHLTPRTIPTSWQTADAAALALGRMA